MSEQGTSDVQKAKQNALENFKFDDKETIALETDNPCPLNRLKPTSAIVVTGYISPNALSFSVNLLCKNSANIAMHFNPRLDRDYIVRNTKFNGTWEKEETCSPTAKKVKNIFTRSSYIHILIFCSPNEFQFAINGQHFCAFAYRMPLEDMAYIEIKGSLEDPRFRQLDLFTYPDPKIEKHLVNLQMDVPMTEFPDVPILVDVKNRFVPNAKLFISGKLKLLPHSFYINLQKGKTIYPHPVVALHVNARFSYGNSAPYVVLNDWSDGTWGKEERHQGLTWMPGRTFHFAIHCEPEAYSIWLDDRMIGQFKHRLMPSIIDTIKITGDLSITELKMCFRK